MATTTETTTETSDLPRPYLFQEHFDAEVMDQLLAHPEGYSRRDIQNLSRYKRSRKQGNLVEVLYERAGKVAQAKSIGRLYPRGGIGLQSFPFDIRNPLLESLYHDLDMANSHYVLLNTLAERWGLKHTAIQTYVDHRDEELSKVSSHRGVAKVAFLKVAYGGNIKLASEFYNDDGIAPEGDITLLKEIEAEMKHIVDSCWTQHKDLHKACSSKDHPRFSCFSYVLQTEETKCLLAIVDYLKTRNREVGVLIHDGCCVRRKEGELTLPVDLLRGAEAAVKETLGYPIRLVVKPWTHGFKREEHTDAILPANVLVDDKYAAQKFVEAMGDSLLMDEGVVWVFNEETGMWSDDKAALERVITALNGTLVFRQMGPMGLKTYDYSGCVEKRNALIRMLPSVAPVRDGVMRSRLGSDIGKLLFVDGIYDFQTATFTPGFDPDIVFTARMPRKFPAVRDEEKIAFIKTHTFTEPFAQTGCPTTGDEKTLLHELMRAAYGDFTRKKALVGLGPNDCSKGMTMMLTQTAFGSYAKSFNGNSLLHKGFGSESEREMTFVLGFCNARYAFSSEIKVPEGKTNVAVDGTLLKTLASGGDEIQARRLHENAKRVVNKAQLFIFANDMPKVAPCTTDVQAKIVPVNWSISFVETPLLPNEKKRMAEMSGLYKQPEYGDAFFHLLCDEYAAWKASGFKELVLPETAKVGLDDLLPAKRLGHVLLERYELTRSILDSVPFEDIKAFVHEQGWEGTDNKLGRELTSLGLGVGKRKEGRKAICLRTGLRQRPEWE
jgi:hypothetical protein